MPSSADLGAVAGLFDAVGLDELDRRALLPVRTDRKYLLDVPGAAALARALSGEHAALEVGGERVFAYDTVYFDTPQLLAYHQHLHGRRKRFKCRTRLYGAAGACWFEVKLRDGRGRTVKRRLALDPSLHGTLSAEGRRFLDGVLLEAYGIPGPDELQPTLATTFARVTLVACEDSDRVTLDAGLAFAAAGGSLETPAGIVLVETKSRHGNSRADRALRELGARPVGSCSKYCVGLALAHAHLRRNRFSRILRRHFEVAAAPHVLPAAA